MGLSGFELVVSDSRPHCAQGAGTSAAWQLVTPNLLMRGRELETTEQPRKSKGPLRCDRGLEKLMLAARYWSEVPWRSVGCIGRGHHSVYPTRVLVAQQGANALLVPGRSLGDSGCF